MTKEESRDAFYKSVADYNKSEDERVKAQNRKAEDDRLFADRKNRPHYEAYGVIPTDPKTIKDFQNCDLTYLSGKASSGDLPPNSALAIMKAFGKNNKTFKNEALTSFVQKVRPEPSASDNRARLDLFFGLPSPVQAGQYDCSLVSCAVMRDGEGCITGVVLNDGETFRFSREEFGRRLHEEMKTPKPVTVTIEKGIKIGPVSLRKPKVVFVAPHSS